MGIERRRGNREGDLVSAIIDNGAAKLNVLSNLNGRVVCRDRSLKRLGVQANLFGEFGNRIGHGDPPLFYLGHVVFAPLIYRTHGTGAHPSERSHLAHLVIKNHVAGDTREQHLVGIPQVNGKQAGMALEGGLIHETLGVLVNDNALFVIHDNHGQVGHFKSEQRGNASHMPQLGTNLLSHACHRQYCPARRMHEWDTP